MTSTLARLTAGAAIAAAVVGGSLVAGTGTSTAATGSGTGFTLYCYQNPSGGNGTRITYAGVIFPNSGGIRSYYGNGYLEQWDGSRYAPVRQVATLNGQTANGNDANSVCNALSFQTSGLPYFVGNFA